MKWIWCNTTQVGFGADAVKDYIPHYIPENSKILCVFGGTSIDKNGAREDVQEALDSLHCEAIWEGGIPPNPEYDRLIEIINIARDFLPDLILAIGGGSVIDGAKFISSAVYLSKDIDPWRILTHLEIPEKYIPIGTVLTIPATGSEWNCGFVISRRSIGAKLAGGNPYVYPAFSLVDPKYTLTLPTKQLRNGVFDAICHCIDQYLTPKVMPLHDMYLMSVFKELVTIGPEVIRPNSSLELHERLIMACSFGLNQFFTLGLTQDWSIHQVGHALTSLYGIDHAVTLAITAIPMLEEIKDSRIELLAKSTEFVFGVYDGTKEEKAEKFLHILSDFIDEIGMPRKVSDVEGVTINQGDVEKLTDMVMQSNGSKPFGYNGLTTRETVHRVLTKIIQ